MKNLFTLFKIIVAALTLTAAIITIQKCFIGSPIIKNIYGELVDHNGKNLIGASIVRVFDNSNVYDMAVTDGKFILCNVPIPENKIITLEITCHDGQQGRARINLRGLPFLDPNTYDARPIKVSFEGFDNAAVIPAKVRTEKKKGTMLRATTSENALIKTYVPEGAKVDILYYYSKEEIVNNKKGRWCCVKYETYTGCIFGTDLIKL